MVAVGDWVRRTADHWEGQVTAVDDAVGVVTLRLNNGGTAVVPTAGVDGRPAAGLSRARQQITTMSAAVAAWQQQITADVAAVQSGGWQALPADQQTVIVLRILNGFTSVINGLLSHAAVTGAIPPETEAP